MKTIYNQYTKSGTAKKLIHQKFFIDFNWSFPWKPGDVIHTEDYMGVDHAGKPVAIFIKQDENTVTIRFIPKNSGYAVIRSGKENCPGYVIR